jgi:hypothetical protein
MIEKIHFSPYYTILSIDGTLRCITDNIELLIKDSKSDGNIKNFAANMVIIGRIFKPMLERCLIEIDLIKNSIDSDIPLEQKLEAERVLNILKEKINKMIKGIDIKHFQDVSMKSEDIKVFL